MTTFHESIRVILTDVEKFLTETIRKDKLSKHSLEEKQLLFEKITKFREEWPQMFVGKGDESPKSNKADSDKDSLKARDEAATTGGSSTTEDGDEHYSDTVPDVPATDVTDVIKSGMLEKKQKKGLVITGKFQKRWCMIRKDIFYYYESKKCKKQCGAFRLTCYKLNPLPDLVKDASKKELCFELSGENKRAYQFIAMSKDDYAEWSAAVETASGELPPPSYAADEDGDIYEAVDDMPQDQAEDQSGEIYDDALVGSAVEPQEVYDDAEVKTPSSVAIKMAVSEDDIYDDAMAAQDTQDEVYDDACEVLPPPPAELLLPELPPLPVSDMSAAPAIPQRGGVPRKPPPNIPLPETPIEIHRPPPNIPLPETPPPEPPRPSRSVPLEPPNIPLPQTPVQPDTLPSRKLSNVVKPEEDFENKYYGKWDCEAESTEELAFKRGEIIHVINRDFDTDSWWVGELHGSIGLVPKDYLMPAYEIAVA